MQCIPNPNRIHNLQEDSMNATNEYSMSKFENHRQHLTQAEYSPIGSSRKLNLLLQRSFRYSYRQRCCGCCPTILCELLFPLLLIVLLVLTRYGTNSLVREMNANPGSTPEFFNRPQCSQNMNIPVTLSNDLLEKCFKFPPSYKERIWPRFNSSAISNTINIVFQPMTNDTNKLVKHAQTRLEEMNCNNTKIW
jgi:hypothetical protein